MYEISKDDLGIVLDVIKDYPKRVLEIIKDAKVYAFTYKQFKIIITAKPIEKKKKILNLQRKQKANNECVQCACKTDKKDNNKHFVKCKKHRQDEARLKKARYYRSKI